jgi:2-oxoglutarate ferredoxin oxidoreductase subunit alpha
MVQRESIVVRFEGSAGDGILSLGTIIAKSAARCGFHVCTLSSFLAEVRGGQSTFQVKLSRRETTSPGDTPDVVVALNRLAVSNQAPFLESSGTLLHPPGVEVNSLALHHFLIDYESACTTATGSTRSKNIVAAGVLTYLLGLDPSATVNVVQQSFGKKSTEVLDAVTRAFNAGVELAHALNTDENTLALKPALASPRMLISGNEAIALGAIVAGVRFFAGYPITPASEIMEILAKHLPQIGGRAMQAEDEIASLGMCIGAAFGGVKTMTATSGPGLSLMTELLGLASMAELPVVVVDVQRAGPSTGMPTKDGQGDLNLAVYGAHGDSPRVVLAPSSVSDCFNDTVRAVNIAHEFHVPVLILSSQSLSHRMQTVEFPSLDTLKVYDEPLFTSPDVPNAPFRRYKRTSDGRPSLRSIPGTPFGMYRTGGLEHDATGQPGFDIDLREQNVAQRALRMKAIENAVSNASTIELPVVGTHPIAVVSWGSSADVTKEAVESLRAQGYDIGYLFPRVIWPMETVGIKRLLFSGIRTLYVCETNHSQQYAQLIRANFLSELQAHQVNVVGINQDNGAPFSAREIQQRLQERLSEFATTIRHAI